MEEEKDGRLRLLVDEEKNSEKRYAEEEYIVHLISPNRFLMAEPIEENAADVTWPAWDSVSWVLL